MSLALKIGEQKMPDESNIPIKFFHGSIPDVYMLNTIYDPDKYDPLSTEYNGTTVPAVGSIIIDNRTSPGNYIQWVVDSIDQLTQKAHLITPKFVTDEVSGADRLISYGNDTLILYYDDTVNPKRLIIDSKFSLIGTHSTEYQLVKVMENDERVTISSTMDINGNLTGNRVPIIETGVDNIRIFGDCYTTKEMAPNEFVELEIYDSTGVLTTRVRLVTQRTTILNDFLSSANPIIDFNCTANQFDGIDWILYLGQDPEDLTIWPELVYSDNSKERLAIDGIQTFVYGMEDISTDTPEVQYKVLIKHFLPDNIPSLIAHGDAVRFLLFEKYIRIVARGWFQYSKIQPMLLWDALADKYIIRYLGYYTSRDKFDIIPNDAVTITDGSFDGGLYGEPQNITITTSLTDAGGNPQEYTQSFTIVINGPTNSVPWTVGADENTEIIYGTNTSVHHRPEINYDEERGSYFIPTSKFATVDELLDNFYVRAEPPYLLPDETVAPTPTHIVIRDSSNGRVLTCSPHALATYEQEFTLLVNGVDVGEHNNKTVIVEFLIDDGDTYSILYGVPVEVKSGTYLAPEPPPCEG